MDCNQSNVPLARIIFSAVFFYMFFRFSQLVLDTRRQFETGVILL